MPKGLVAVLTQNPAHPACLVIMVCAPSIPCYERRLATRPIGSTHSTARSLSAKQRLPFWACYSVSPYLQFPEVVFAKLLLTTAASANARAFAFCAKLRTRNAEPHVLVLAILLSAAAMAPAISLCVCDARDARIAICAVDSTCAGLASRACHAARLGAVTGTSAPRRLYRPTDPTRSRPSLGPATVARRYVRRRAHASIALRAQTTRCLLYVFHVDAPTHSRGFDRRSRR